MQQYAFTEYVAQYRLIELNAEILGSKLIIF